MKIASFLQRWNPYGAQLLAGAVGLCLVLMAQPKSYGQGPSLGSWYSCSNCYWQIYQNTNFASCTNCPSTNYVCRVWKYSYSGVAYVNRYVAAVVSETNATLTATSGKLNGTPQATEDNVSMAHRLLLIQELQARGMYNAATQQVAFVQSVLPFAISNGSHGQLAVMFNGGLKLTQGVAHALVASESDLDDGPPLTPLLVVADDLALDPPPGADCSPPAPIPTLSEWALIILALLLLGIGAAKVRPRLRPSN